MAVVCRDGSTLDFSRVQRAPEQKIKLSPHPYPHWTIKEINDQPKALGRALNFGGRIMNDKVRKIFFYCRYDSLLNAFSFLYRLNWVV